MSKSWVIFFIFTWILCELISQSILCQSVVHLDSGMIIGSLHKAELGNVTEFLGIQYGEPPVGNLRFKLPVPVAAWKGIRKVNKYGPMCVQSKFFMDKIDNLNDTLMDENCLFLNVHVPGNNFGKQTSKKIPVLVFIHAGHFLTGSGSLLDGSVLAVRTNAIVVTFNYRLGIFGFLSITNQVPGNLGLHDQLLALHWVRSNIGSFGGDNENVCILTSSTEAKILQTSIHFRSLFSKMISYDDLFPSSFGYIGASDELLLSTSWPSYCKDLNVLTCLQNLSTQDIKDISLETYSSWTESLYHPVVDGVIITQHPDIMIQIGNFKYVDHIVLSQYTSPSSSKVHLDNCSKETLFSVMGYIGTYEGYRMNTNQKLLLQTLFSPTMDTSDGYCTQIKSLLLDFCHYDNIRNLNDQSNFALTFLALYSVTDSQHIVNDSLNFTPEYAVTSAFADQFVGECQSVELEDKTSTIIRTFLFHGFPSTDDSSIFRPYTRHSKNHLILEGHQTKTGNAKNWPFMKTELLWHRLLPSLGRNKTYKNEGFQCSQHIQESIDWGMSEQQLEAMVFSLVLTCLFLLMSTLTLLRIICHVKGKPFYNSRQMAPLKCTLVGSDVTAKKYHRSGHNSHSKIFSVANTNQNSDLDRGENQSSFL